MASVTRALLFLLLLFVAAGGGLYHFLLGDLPSPHSLSERLLLPSVRISDRHGRPLYELIDADAGRHAVLPLEQIPILLQQATIATEDKNFYQNPGVDMEGILRAFWVNLRGGEVLAGGSTITQQVSRNLLLAEEERSQRTVRRKLRESWLAWRVARSYGKAEILALYLNQMYYGGMAYGVEAAAQTYFGKRVSDLTLAESALLAGLPQAPSLYNPFTNAEAAKARQLVVLDLMRKGGFITPEQLALATREPLQYATTPYPVMAPHFVMMVRAELDRLFSQEEIYQAGGLVVRTTLDLDWQKHAERLTREQLDQLSAPVEGGPGHEARNAALVAVHPEAGDVLALVGNADYFDERNGGAINMAISPRQPGSALKPIIYAAALAAPGNGDGEWSGPWTAASMIMDVRTLFETREGGIYVPVNFSRQEHGPVLLRQALAASLNIPAVVVLDAIGVERAMDLAIDMGITTLDNREAYDLSYALGGGPVRLLDLTTAYAAFANGGSRLAPRLILEASDAAGKVVYTAPPQVPVRVLDERIAWLISDILSDHGARQLSFGANSVLNLDRPAAVKTGTSNDYRDNWTVGYTPDLVVGVWVGNSDHRPMRDVTGVSGAGPIWHRFMRTALAGRPEAVFVRPPGLVQAEICTLSGLLPGDDCPYRRREWFLAGTQPSQTDTFFTSVYVDSVTGLPATEMTPPPQRVKRLFLDLPLTLHPWARAQGLALLDDWLTASDQGGDASKAEASQADSPAETAASPMSTSEHDLAKPLRLVAPDRQAVYRISPALPAEAQQVRLEAVAAGSVRQISLWMDGVQLATPLDPPFEAWWSLTPGHHRAWAQGRDATGRLLSSEPVLFEVLDIAEARELP